MDINLNKIIEEIAQTNDIKKLKELSNKISERAKEEILKNDDSDFAIIEKCDKLIDIIINKTKNQLGM